MLGMKYDNANLLSIEAAEYLHENGVVIVVTDGRYTQLDEEEK